MRKMKRMFAAGVLSALMGMMTALPVLAAQVPACNIDENARGSLSIYKYDMTSAAEDHVSGSFSSDGEKDLKAEEAYKEYAVQGVVFTYLKVADIEMRSISDADGREQIEMVYGLTKEAKEAFSCIGINGDNLIEEKNGLSYYTSDVLQNGLSSALKANTVSVKNSLEEFIVSHGGSAMTETNSDGFTKASGLPLGLYLIVETAVPENVTGTVNPFFVSLPMTNPSGNEWMYDVTVYPKNETGMPDLKKEVAEVTSSKTSPVTYADTATASDGDVIAYKITSKLPVISSEATYLTTYTFTDTLSDGIAYKKGDVTLTWTSPDGSPVSIWTEKSGKFSVNYTAGDNGSEKMTIAMTSSGLSEINPSYSQYTVVINYQALMQKDATVVYGDEGNPNEVELIWKRTNMTYYDILKDDCLVYTYGIQLKKLFSDEEGNFQKVHFTLMNASDQYYVEAQQTADGVYYVSGSSKNGTIFTPSSEGILLIYGLEDDLYTMKETQTDTGYSLLKDSIQINLKSIAEGHSRTAEAEVNGDKVEMLNSGISENALVPLTVTNTKKYDIPATGDDGMFWIPVFGIAGSALLCLILFRRTRRTNV